MSNLGDYNWNRFFLNTNVEFFVKKYPYSVKEKTSLSYHLYFSTRWYYFFFEIKDPIIKLHFLKEKNNWVQNCNFWKRSVWNSHLAKLSSAKTVFWGNIENKFNVSTQKSILSSSAFCIVIIKNFQKKNQNGLKIFKRFNYNVENNYYIELFITLLPRKKFMKNTYWEA